MKDGCTGVISNWEGFETYPWPGPEEVDYYGLEYMGRHLPDGMQVIYLGPAGVLENMMWLVGYVPLALALKDDRGLVEAVAQKVGELLISTFSTAAEMPGVGALWLGDDMGFKTGTLISPEDLRRYVLPWQKEAGRCCSRPRHTFSAPFLRQSP